MSECTTNDATRAAAQLEAQAAEWQRTADNLAECKAALENDDQITPTTVRDWIANAGKFAATQRALARYMRKLGGDCDSCGGSGVLHEFTISRDAYGDCIGHAEPDCARPCPDCHGTGLSDATRALLAAAGITLEAPHAD